MFDASFMSYYNSRKQDVDYYVQRLVSVPLEKESSPEEGRIWNLYINGHLEDWMQIMRHNRIVCKEDSIVWRYHLRGE